DPRHLHSFPTRRSSDLFPAERVAVFVDADSWHGSQLPTWEHKLSPFWRDKLRANRGRYCRNFRRLRSRGWAVVSLRQHEILADRSEEHTSELQSRSDLV